MTPQEFLAHVLPNQGFYCLAAKNDKIKGVRHKTYTDLDEMVSDAAAFNSSLNEIYFSISTLEKTSVINSSGKAQIRIGANCLQTKSLILDVDVRDKPGFHNVFKEALQDIVSLSKQLALCKPTIVFTGGGFHVYWTASESLQAAEFAEKSSHFKALVLAEFPKLGADATRISDRTSLLRIPSFINVKRQQTVKIISEGDTFDIGKISSWHSVGKVNGTHVLKPLSTAPGALNLFAKSLPVNLSGVISNCAVLKDMDDTGGANYDEPAWYAMLGLVKHGEQASAYAHKLSNSHPGYDFNETENKLNQAISTNTGPTTCRYFDGLGGGLCRKCKFWGKITSPIQLAASTVIATINAVAQVNYVPPKPYARRTIGGIIINPVSDDGKEDENAAPELIYDYDLYPIKKLFDETNGNWYIRYRHFLPVDGWQENTVPLSGFADKRAAIRTLMDGGVVPTFGQGTKARNVGRYMIDCIRELSKSEAASQMYNQFGWRKDDSAIIIGDRMYEPGGIVSKIEASGPLRELVKKFESKGTIQKWADIFDTYNKPGLECYAFGALISFASILYKFTGHSGIIYNMVGEAGTGKSTVLKVLSSVWMKPEEQLLKESDTVNSAEVILGAMHNLPVVYDEITNIKDEKLSDLCYNITQGRGRNRLNAEAKLRHNSANWSLVLCSTSNLSLIDKLNQLKANSTAEAVRVFEVRIDGNTVLDKTTADAAFRRIDSNYGLAGELYAQYVINNKDAIITQLDETILAIDKDIGIRSPERFWSALLGCVMVGGEISKNLGLHRYDMDILYAWARRHIEGMRSNVSEKISDYTSILGNFIASKSANTAVFIQGKYRDTLMSHAKNQIQIRLEIEQGSAVAFVEYKAVVDFCKENNISISWWADKLKANNILLEVKSKRLTAGCNDMPSISIKCWILNLAKQEFRSDIKRIVEAVKETSGEKL